MAAVNKTSEPVAMANNGKRKQIVKEERDLIEVVNNLQNKLIASGHSIEISLPQIVVVGCQSAGKSSVLENIVGKEFLPRGTGVVTRRPIVVQLNPCSEEYAVFLHKPTEIFRDFAEVRNEIQRVTSEATGKNLFSSKPIHIQIYSPNVLKLTLVDLPGLVKISLGDQPDNIVSEVHDMVVEYISQPKSLILAVSPANQDLANSDALNIAKMVDKNRERTIGVLTKLDLMDQGTDARDVLENKILSLKRGYVGVINRSQKDIEDKKDITYALQKERDFFRNHPAYRHLANRMGTMYLRQLLQKQLQAHIKEYLGEVRKELSDSYAKNKKKLDDLNARLGRGGDNKQVLMLRIVQQFVDSMKMKFLGQSEHVDLSVVSPGAHINYLMYTKVQQNLNVELIPDQKELTIAIANILGLRTAIAVPTLAFDVMCRRLIEKYKEPIQQCVSTVSKIIIQAVEESAMEISGYPSLRSELIYRVSACVKNQEEITKEVLLNHVEAEMYCVNIGHPDFESSILNHIAPPTGPVKIWEEELSQPEDACDHSNAPETDDQDIPLILLNKLLTNEATQKKVIYVTGLISKYLEVVRKTMGDIVIKYILFFLVKHALDFVSFSLSADLSSLGNIDSLMQECEEDIQKQAELEFTCETIQSALEAIQSF